jgi:hypothetical protein
MEWYRLKGISHDPTIEPVQVVSYTEKYVMLDGGKAKQLRIGSYERFYRTREEAVNAAVEYQRKEVEKSQQWLDKAQSKLDYVLEKFA